MRGKGGVMEEGVELVRGRRWERERVESEGEEG